MVASRLLEGREMLPPLSERQRAAPASAGRPSVTHRLLRRSRYFATAWGCSPAAFTTVLAALAFSASQQAPQTSLVAAGLAAAAAPAFADVEARITSAGLPAPSLRAWAAKLKSAPSALPPDTITLISFSPSFSCQATSVCSPSGRLPGMVNVPSSLLTPKNGCSCTATNAPIHGCTSHLI